MQAIQEATQILEKYISNEPEQFTEENLKIPAEGKELISKQYNDEVSPTAGIVVLKVNRGYKVEDLNLQKSFMVSKVNGQAFCSCRHGKDQEIPCIHKQAVWKNWKRLQKLGANEYLKNQLQAGLGLYIRHLEHRVREMEDNFQTGYRYEHLRGKLLGLKFAFDYISEA